MNFLKENPILVYPCSVGIVLLLIYIADWWEWVELIVLPVIGLWCIWVLLDFRKKKKDPDAFLQDERTELLWLKAMRDTLFLLLIWMVVCSLFLPKDYSAHVLLSQTLMTVPFLLAGTSLLHKHIL